MSQNKWQYRRDYGRGPIGGAEAGELIKDIPDLAQGEDQRGIVRGIVNPRVYPEHYTGNCHCPRCDPSAE